jgi:predicted transcriptional regulator
MINFACKNIELDEVVRCSLNLSNAEFRLISFFVKHPDKNFSTLELSKKLSLDKSTIQRGVKKLHGKGLLFRTQLNQSVGGYLFKYRIKNKSEIKKKILEILESWNSKVRKELRDW